MAKKKTPTNKTGRPSEYKKEIADKICARIAEGESVRSIVRDKLMPSSSTIFRWLLDDDKKTFWEQYARARSIQAENMFEELLEIADDGTNDWIEKENRNGDTFEVPNHEYINRSRLRVDTRKWYLSKVLPKKFGDKLDLTTDGDKLPTPIMSVVPDNAVPRNNSDEEDQETEEED